MNEFPNHPSELLSLLYENYNLLKEEKIERNYWLQWCRDFNKHCSELSFDFPEYKPSLNYIFVVWNIMNNIQIENKVDYLPELQEVTAICREEISKLYEK